MNLVIISSIFALIGGIGIFLYGVDIMGKSLQKVAGEKLSYLLRTLTKNKISGILLGALITALIQSSTGTTVMVVGFVNAGLMSLESAVSVIMGANIGTTLTAWIVSLSSLGDAMIIFKPEFLAPLILGLSTIVIVFSKNERTKLKATVFLGLGLLFLGISLMSTAMAPFSSSPIFINVIKFLGNNPILGIITGAVVTIILQSSAASVSILQTLSLSGEITRSACIYITLGQNIGTCLTALVSSINSSKNAKRAAFIHLFFNVAGAVIFGVAFALLTPLIKDFMNGSMTIVQISIFHTFFNVANTIILAPFSEQIVKLSKWIIKGDDEAEVSVVDSCKQKLDERFLKNTNVAVASVHEEILNLFTYTRNNLERALLSLCNEQERNKAIEVHKCEQEINQMTILITQYLVKVNNLDLTENNRKKVEDMISIASDIERIGDHAENVANSAQALDKEKATFSDAGIKDLNHTIDVTMKCVEQTYLYLETLNPAYGANVFNYEDKIDELKDEYKVSHIDRLSTGKCNIYAGVAFLDTLTNLERVTDHCKNIVEYSYIGFKED